MHPPWQKQAKGAVVCSRGFSSPQAGLTEGSCSLQSSLPIALERPPAPPSAGSLTCVFPMTLLIRGPREEVLAKAPKGSHAQRGGPVQSWGPASVQAPGTREGSASLHPGLNLCQAHVSSGARLLFALLFLSISKHRPIHRLESVQIQPPDNVSKEINKIKTRPRQHSAGFFPLPHLVVFSLSDP